MPDLTPVQRQELVDQANHRILVLGQYMLEIADRGRPTDVQAFIRAFNDVAETLRALCWEVEWVHQRGS